MPRASHAYSLSATSAETRSENIASEQRIRRHLREDMTARFAYVRDAIRTQPGSLDMRAVGFYRHQHSLSVRR
jgi:hypothetical protein